MRTSSIRGTRFSPSFQRHRCNQDRFNLLRSAQRLCSAGGRTVACRERLAPAWTDLDSNRREKTPLSRCIASLRSSLRDCASSIAVGRYDIQYLAGEFVSAPAGTKLFVSRVAGASRRLPATRLSVPTLGGHGDRFGLARGQDHRRSTARISKISGECTIAAAPMVRLADSGRPLAPCGPTRYGSSVPAMRRCDSGTTN